MSKSYTPKYRIEYTEQTGTYMTSWPSDLGTPTDAKAEAWRIKMNESWQPGGYNDHIIAHCGFVLHISRVKVVCQKKGANGRMAGEVVAEARMPMFEVV